MKKFLFIFFILPFFVKAQTSCTNGPNTIVVDAIQTAPITCAGYCNGAATVTISGGSGNYNYSWTGPSFTSPTQNISALCPGTYIVTVTDNTFGIVCSDFVTISQPAPLNVSISITNCSAYGSCDGSATLTITGGTMPYVITWYNSSMTPISGQTGLTLSGRCAGNYYYSVTDASNCPPNVGLGLIPFTIGQPASTLSISAIFGTTACASDVPPFCTGGIDGTATGGTPPYTFYLNGMSSGSNSFGDFMNLCVGGYTVTVVDAVGSTSSVSGGIFPTWPSPSVSVTITPPSCVGVCDATVQINASGGTPPYMYSNNYGNMFPTFQTSNLFTGLCGGYSNMANVSDNHGCKAFPPANVNVPNATPVGLSISNITNESLVGANDGSVNANATHPLTNNYTLNGSNPQSNGNYTGLAPGNYTICAFTSSGCSQCLNFTINGGPSCGLNTIEQSQNVSCYDSCDGTIDLSVSGNNGSYNVTWDNSQMGVSLNSLCDGWYIYSIEDSLGCTFIDSIEITEPLQIDLSLSSNGTMNSASMEGEINATATNGIGNYYFSIDNGVSWQTSGDFDSLSAGDYLICVTDSLNCMVCDSVTVNAGPVCNLQSSIQTTEPLCFGNCNGSIEMDLTGNYGTYTILWDNSQSGDSLVGLCSMNYIYQITDSIGCSLSDTVFLDQPSLIGLDTVYVNPTSSTSFDGTITLTGTGGTPPYQYSIDGFISVQSSGSFSNLGPGTYSVGVLDSNMCFTVMSIIISAPTDVSETKKNELSVFPMPALDLLHIQTNNGMRRIQLTDMTGKIILTENVSGEIKNHTLDIGKFSNGIYLLEVITTNGISAIKIVLE